MLVPLTCLMTPLTSESMIMSLGVEVMMNTVSLINNTCDFKYHVSPPLKDMMTLATHVSVVPINIQHLHHYDSINLPNQCRPLIILTIPLTCIAIPLISDYITLQQDVDTLDKSSVTHQRQVRHSKSCVTIYGRHLGHLISCVSTFGRHEDHCNSCVSTC